MARVLISLGGLRSDQPCGEPPLGGKAILSLCFNEHWVDWHRTAVSLRGRVIDAIKDGEGTDTARTDAVTWLKGWTDGGLAAKAIAISNPASTTDAKWPPDPGLVWSKPRLTAMVEYAIRGAGLLGLLTGDEILKMDHDVDEQRGRSLVPLAIGVGVGALAIVALLVAVK